MVKDRSLIFGVQCTFLKLSFRASVHTQDNFKWTPLHFACHAGQKDIVELLLDKGANLEAKTLNGATPLMRAVESSKPELVQFLIDRGGKVQDTNNKGGLNFDECAFKIFCLAVLDGCTLQRGIRQCMLAAVFPTTFVDKMQIVHRVQFRRGGERFRRSQSLRLRPRKV